MSRKYGQLSKSLANLRVSRPSTALADVIINPIGMEPKRFPTHSGCKETAVSKYDFSLFYNTTAGSIGSYPFVPATDNIAIIFRDPLRAVVYMAKNTGVFSYTAYFTDNAGSLATTLPITQNLLDSNLSISPTYWKSGTTVAPHGPYLYPGMSQGSLYTWCDANVTITFTFNNSVSGQIVAYRWEGPGEHSSVPYVVTISATTSAAFTFGTSGQLQFGYWCFEFTPTTAIPATTTLSAVYATSATQDVFAHLAIPEIQNNLNSYNMLRVNAAAMLWMNEAAPLYKDGTISGVNIPTSTPWYTITSTATIQSMAGYWDGKLSTGCYTYLPLSNYVVDTAYFSYVAITGNNAVPTYCAFNLDAETTYNYVRSTSVSQSSTSFPGQEFTLHFSWHTEFQTTLQTPAREYCSLMTAELERAEKICQRMPKFVENPSHPQMIKQALLGGLNFVRQHRVMIGHAIAGNFAPLATMMGTKSYAQRRTPTRQPRPQRQPKRPRAPPARRRAKPPPAPKNAKQGKRKGGLEIYLLKKRK